MAILYEISIILVVLTRFGGSSRVGTCDLCLDSNNVACLDENHFSTCYNGEITATVTKCPDNSVCTTDRRICRLPDDGFTPICYEENCDNCKNLEANFTCLDQTTYGFCSQAYAETIYSCPKGYVCNVYTKDICVPSETNKPSCLKINPTTSSLPPTTTESTTTTIKPPVNANEFCAELGKVGYFKSNDPTCKEYIYCYLLSGQYLGTYFYCAGFFNEVTMNCQAERPSDCIEE
ncbi:uncharacterized protein LOC142236080 [Haematobia irritans]|uniref:uncharacterized protein LOC142236080 n=1 Tax=Haematobia irritans TaxID=7368 RepID=UPI003F50B332